MTTNKTSEELEKEFESICDEHEVQWEGGNVTDLRQSVKLELKDHINANYVSMKEAEEMIEEAFINGMETSGVVRDLLIDKKLTLKEHRKLVIGKIKDLKHNLLGKGDE